MEANLLEISDGKLYSLNDMVKVGCQDCADCSDCCHDMGQSILLDPYDIWQLRRNLQMDFQQLMAAHIELHVEEGLILPNLKMAGEKDPRCSFLNEAGRCSIHGFRPGICRLFPLGRSYEEDRLSYFVLKDACPAPNKTKIKVIKWLGQPQAARYEQFLVTWHNLVKQMRALLEERSEDAGYARMLTMKFLEVFFVQEYGEDFYGEFAGRVETMQVLLG